MKREKSKNRFGIKEVYIRWFWTECWECKEEFKKEKMFKHAIYINPVCNFFYCKGCFPTIEVLDKYLSKRIDFFCGLSIPNE